MSDAVEQVAALEVEAAEAASAAQVAQEAAIVAVAAAETLVANERREAAEQIAEVVAEAAVEIAKVDDAVANHEGEIEWLKTNMTEMRSSIATLTELVMALSSASSTPPPPPPEPTPEPASANVVDPLAVVESPPAVPPRRKAHRLL